MCQLFILPPQNEAWKIMFMDVGRYWKGEPITDLRFDRPEWLVTCNTVFSSNQTATGPRLHQSGVRTQAPVAIRPIMALYKLSLCQSGGDRRVQGHREFEEYFML